uniref:Dipeptidyl aminopeptidase-like protein 6 n=1 Tax=Panagrellus redivivus TaxID=6233 RepID=A0A7E4ZW03_PANRE
MFARAGGGGGPPVPAFNKSGGGSSVLAAELIGSAPQQRNWRGIVTALLVIGGICSMIFIAILIFTPMGYGSLKTGTPVSLSDVVGPSFMSPIEAMDFVDGQHLSVRYADSVVLLDVSKSPPEKSVLLDSDALFRYGKPNIVSVTPDRRYVIAGYSVWKKPGKLNIRIYDTTDSSFEDIGPTKSGEEPIQVLAWNPKDHDFAFVHENDIYYQEKPGTKAVKRITTSGNATVLNGVADWIYEEEILQTSKALWWSKDGQDLAFLTIDNTKVDKVDIPQYGKRQYPETIRMPYPKTGAAALPLIKLNAWRKTDGVTKTFEVGLRTAELATYLFSAKWIKLHGQSVLVAVFSNRFQNHTTITLCTYESGKCLPNHEQRYTLGDMSLWAEPENYDVTFHNDKSYFVMLPQLKPSGNVYTQIARVTVSADLSTSRVAFVSLGEYDVDRINYYDAKREKIYFTAAAPTPSKRFLYEASALPTVKNTDHCLTCNVSKECTFHETQFSSDGDHLFLNCKGIGLPHVILSSLSSNLSNMGEYGRNPYLEKAIHYTQVLPRVLYDNVTLRNGYQARVKMLLPPGLNDIKSYDKRYPVLIDVYAGPGTQKATDEWLANSVDIYFASNPHYVVVLIDGRGSGGQGWRQKAPMYGALGTVEVDDQIETVRRLMAKYYFMDNHRVAIWGWSYGGFVAARAVERDTRGTFRCAASVAPVTHFKFYDATYTERYMSSASKEAYEATDLSHNVTAFHDVQYFLAHGTGDDNVHFQNTAVFIRALSDENVQFDLSVYPDDTHSLGSSRWHLYHKLTNFFKRCFDLDQTYYHKK